MACPSELGQYILDLLATCSEAERHLPSIGILEAVSRWSMRELRIGRTT